MSSLNTVFEKVFFETKDRLYNYVSRFIADEDEAEDIVQQCYIKLWTNMDKLNITDSLMPLLYTYAKNGVIDHLRKTAREKKNLQHYYQQVQAPAFDNTNELTIKETLNQVKHIIARLPAKRKQVLLLKKEYDLSNGQIAAIMQISNSTVEKQLREAIRFIKEETRHLQIPLVIFLYAGALPPCNL